MKSLEKLSDYQLQKELERRRGARIETEQSVALEEGRKFFREHDLYRVAVPFYFWTVAANEKEASQNIRKWLKGSGDVTAYEEDLDLNPTHMLAVKDPGGEANQYCAYEVDEQFRNNGLDQLPKFKHLYPHEDVEHFRKLKKLLSK